MSIKDFRARQVRASALIASGGLGVSGKTDLGLLVYSSSAATNLIGGRMGTMLNDVGTDVWLFVSGTSNNTTFAPPGVRSGDGVTLFGGDVVVSGTFYAEKMVVEVDQTSTGSLMISGSLFVSQSVSIGQISDMASDLSSAGVLDLSGNANEGKPTLFVTHEDDDQVGIDLNINSTTAVGIDVDATTTTGNVVDVAASTLTTGRAKLTTVTATPPDGSNNTIEEWDIDFDGTGSSTGKGLFVNYDKDGVTASGKTATVYGVQVDVDDSATNVGTVNLYGLEATATAASTNGTITVYGANISAAGGDTNIGLQVTSVDKALRLKYDADEYADFSVTSAGVLTIATADDSSDSGAITLDTVDKITLDSDTDSEGIVYAAGGTELLQIYNDGSQNVKFLISQGSKTLEILENGGTSLVHFGEAAGTVFNDGHAAAYDFRVESDNKTSAILLDAGTEQLALLAGGTAASDAYQSPPNPTGRALPSDIGLWISGAMAARGITTGHATKGVSVFSGDLVTSGAVALGLGLTLPGASPTQQSLIVGVHSITGSDVGIFFSGSKGQKSAINSYGTTLFGGDVYMSGALYADDMTILDDLAVGDDLSVGGDITVAGVTKIANGSAGAPSLAFTTDTDTGIFLSSAGIMNFSTAGTERLEIAAGAVVFNDSGADTDFRVEMPGRAGGLLVDAGTIQVAILSEGINAGEGYSDNESATLTAIPGDVGLFVSGAILGVGITTGDGAKGVSLFGGDLSVSGSAHLAVAQGQAGDTQPVSQLLMVGATSITGSDVSMFFTGSKGQKGALNSYGTVLFGGDLVSSGNIHGFEDFYVHGTKKIYFEDAVNKDQYITSAGSGVTAVAAPTEIDLTAPTVDINASTEVNISGQTTIGGTLLVAEYINHTGDTDTGIRFQTDSIDFIAGSGGGSTINLSEGIAGSSFGVNTNRANADLVIINASRNDVDTYIMADTDEKALFAGIAEAGSEQVLILSGGAGESDDEATGTDIAFFVSGTKGSRNTDRRGTSLFGGDVAVSGTIHALGDATIGDDLTFNSDGAKLSFGTDSEVTLTHVHNTGLLLSDDSGVGVTKLMFGDDATFIQQQADGELGIDADSTINITAPTVDIDASSGVDISNSLTVGANLSVASNIVQTGDTANYIQFGTDILTFNVTNTQFVIDDVNDRISVGNPANPAGTSAADIIIQSAVANKFLVHAKNGAIGSQQVLILSGGAGTSLNEANATDISFFVSGTVGSKDTSVKGTSVFGGDLVVSGNTYLNVNGAYPGQLLGVGTDVEFFVSGSRVTKVGSLLLSGGVSSGAGVSVVGGDLVVSGALYGADPYGLGERALEIKSTAVTITQPNDEYMSFSGGSDAIFVISASIDSTAMNATGGSNSRSVIGGALEVSGALRVGAGRHVTGVESFDGGTISGSIHETEQGVSYLIAGANITISSASNGQVTITSTGGGDVDVSGTPANNQVAIWTDADTLEGTSAFTYDGTTIGLNDAVTVNEGGGDNDFRVESQGNTHAVFVDASTNQVVLGSKAAPTLASDVGLFISGTIGGIGASAGDQSKGSTIIGGDLLVSGTVVTVADGISGGSISGSIHETSSGISYLVAGNNVSIASGTNGQVTISATAGSVTVGSDADNRVVTSDADGSFTAESALVIDGSTLTLAGNIIPDSDNSRDLGSTDKRFSNIYTGDLHLRNERGDWSIIEEEDYLSITNNKNGKKYKFVLEEIE